MKKVVAVVKTNQSKTVTTARHKERRAMKVLREQEKQEKRKTVPRGTARVKRRKSLRTLYEQEARYKETSRAA